MIKKMYDNSGIELWCGDYRDYLQKYSPRFDCVVTDPPYGITALSWDRWVKGWFDDMVSVSSSLWCFGTFRMFVDHWEEITAAGWKMSQDCIWSKGRNTDLVSDRFGRSHETILHFYIGKWQDIYHEVPRYSGQLKEVVINEGQADHQADHVGKFLKTKGVRMIGQPRKLSVFEGRKCEDQASTGNLTSKPVGILSDLIDYSCPEGGCVLDPFCGSGSTLLAARNLGRRAVGIELREEQIPFVIRRLEQSVFNFA